MKLECIKNQIETGFFSRKTKTLPLTVGKVYEVVFTEPTDNSSQRFYIDITRVYTDNNKWEIFEGIGLDLFKPIDK